MTAVSIVLPFILGFWPYYGHYINYSTSPLTSLSDLVWTV